MRITEWRWPAGWVLVFALFLIISCAPKDPATESSSKSPGPAAASAAAADRNAKVEATPVVITPEEARQHKGETVTVRGKVADVHVTQKGDMFLNFGGKFPSAVFTAVCFQGTIPAAELMPLNGKTISVTGRIREYSGQVEIVLNSADQIVKESGK